MEQWTTTGLREVSHSPTTEYTGDSLEGFRQWYLEQGLPTTIPVTAQVFRTDIASAITLYKYKQFAVELYIIDRQELVDHAHPNVNLIQMIPFSVVDGKQEWSVKKLLPAGQRHGSSDSSVCPPVMLVFEEWINEKQPTSVSVDWHGPILGPLHRDLINKHSPATKIENGFALGA